MRTNEHNKENTIYTWTAIIMIMVIIIIAIILTRRDMVVRMADPGLLIWWCGGWIPGC